ncbi:IS3 family transposase [Curtobacterium flaccumfaciens]|nr:IS3 family transposase [Curtobacterium flaccumfaciens]
MNVPRRYSPELKLRAAKAIVNDGEPRFYVARRFEIRSHSTMDQWADQYRKHGELAFTPIARIERSSAEKSSTVAQERSALADVLAHLDTNLPTEMKVQIVQSLAGQYPVRVLLRALSLPPSTYYYRRSRPPKEDRYAAVRPMLRREFETAYSANGYRRMRVRLRRKHGLQISGKTVRRLMREEGCRCQVRRRKRRMPPEAVNPANVFAPNLLQRNFAADLPGRSG